VGLSHHEFDAELLRDLMIRHEQANPHAGGHYLARMGVMKQDVMADCFYLPLSCSNLCSLNK
jgi:hypothetical protein